MSDYSFMSLSQIKDTVGVNKGQARALRNQNRMNNYVEARNELFKNNPTTQTGGNDFMSKMLSNAGLSGIASAAGVGGFSGMMSMMMNMMMMGKMFEMMGMENPFKDGFGDIFKADKKEEATEVNETTTEVKPEEGDKKLTTKQQARIDARNMANEKEQNKDIKRLPFKMVQGSTINDQIKGLKLSQTNITPTEHNDPAPLPNDGKTLAFLDDKIFSDLEDGEMVRLYTPDNKYSEFTKQGENLIYKSKDGSVTQTFGVDGDKLGSIQSEVRVDDGLRYEVSFNDGKPTKEEVYGDTSDQNIETREYTYTSSGVRESMHLTDHTNGEVTHTDYQPDGKTLKQVLTTKGEDEGLVKYDTKGRWTDTKITKAGKLIQTSKNSFASDGAKTTTITNYSQSAQGEDLVSSKTVINPNGKSKIIEYQYHPNGNIKEQVTTENGDKTTVTNDENGYPTNTFTAKKDGTKITVSHVGDREYETIEKPDGTVSEEEYIVVDGSRMTVDEYER